MTDLTQPTLNVAGAGVAELPIPKWARLAKAAIVLATFMAAVSGTLALCGWEWIGDGFNASVAMKIAAAVTVAIAVAVLPWLLGWLNTLLNIRWATSRWVFGGFYRKWHLLRPILVLLGLVGISIMATHSAVQTSPLPELIAKVQREVQSPKEGLLPVYFWDYATFIDPTWLETTNLVLPYEKGPPQKLLPKIYFQDVKSGAIVLELHGKRPRTYDVTQVLETFSSSVVLPRDWPLLFKLQKEAGLITDRVKASTLYLLRLRHADTSTVTQAIGVPWESSTPASGNKASGRMFFWGPDGAVFQVKCPSPCTAASLLELVRFPADPRGSHAERLKWTKERLKKLLAEPMPESGSPARFARENLLSFYLVSMLTLDPRDPEAFFHLGKLAKNRETISSAIRYGRDLGLEPMKILELEATLDRMR